MPFCALIFLFLPIEEVNRHPYQLGDFHREITTTSDKAQMWFDRGLALIFAFNHEEAVFCFEQAIEANPIVALGEIGFQGEASCVRIVRPAASFTLNAGDMA